MFKTLPFLKIGLFFLSKLNLSKKFNLEKHRQETPPTASSTNRTCFPHCDPKMTKVCFGN
ncbi:hypothetical protein C943_00333 [Mariniradius saccharolyticus AK6]|uniref:Uncharacterized protein n=1 Tax=Mariniradius saccharolyticus AK6 TaxID=1239962 RepID=M7Y753_9BACT|nr:hypothetical protein C943_00333 [Mariniradius saccharolyticus AK6]